MEMTNKDAGDRRCPQCGACTLCYDEDHIPGDEDAILRCFGCNWSGKWEETEDWRDIFY